jgi:Kef-type K+ transport system membrane component KefB
VRATLGADARDRAGGSDGEQPVVEAGRSDPEPGKQRLVVAVQLDAQVSALSWWPDALVVVPLLALTVLAARGLPTVLLHLEPREATVGAGLLFATSLPFIVTAAQVGLGGWSDRGRDRSGNDHGGTRGCLSVPHSRAVAPATADTRRSLGWLVASCLTGDTLNL